MDSKEFCLSLSIFYFHIKIGKRIGFNIIKYALSLDGNKADDNDSREEISRALRTYSPRQVEIGVEEDKDARGVTLTPCPPGPTWSR